MANASTKQTADSSVWSGRRHLLDTKDLSKDEVIYLVNKAKDFKKAIFDNRLAKGQNSVNSLRSILADKVVANLFYENSTRTRMSFELASKRLGMHVLNLDINQSSVQKGESIEDTARTLAAMGVDVIVQRHTQTGSAAQVIAATDDKVHLINAGEGITAHPTQALLDIFTMFESGSSTDLSGKKLVIVGDIEHSRVARSIMWFAPLFGFAVHLVAPTEWLPKKEEIFPTGVTMYRDLNEAIVDADFVVALRVQLERIDTVFEPTKYISLYQITHERLKHAKSSVKVMHPGPMNRDVEISAKVADDNNISLITRQVQNGIPIRMAVLEALSSTDE